MREGRLPGAVSELGTLPEANTAQGIAIAMQEGGVLLIRFNSGMLNGQSLRMVPVIEKQQLYWRCESESIETEHLSAYCD